MPKTSNAVSDALRRIDVLRGIGRAERLRAESKPFDRRNRDLGLVEQDTPSGQVGRQIAQTFNELQALLDHLAVAHMAASFEEAAKNRMGTIIGGARRAIERDRKPAGRWPANLVRRADSFDGLKDLGSVLPLTLDEDAAFALIRSVRNRFGHAVQVDRPPAITGEDALPIFEDMLERIA